jgi:hypothetical protein
MILWALIRQLPPEHYFYCDTDGLLTTQSGFDKLHHRIDNLSLGALKHVATYHDVWINGCKDLILDGKRKCKGIRDKGNDPNKTVFEQIKWYGLAGLLHEGSINMPLTEVITKTLRRAYDKGVVLPSGFVTPFHAPEEIS